MNGAYKKPLGVALALAITLTSALAIAAQVYGYHSTPVIWLAFLNFPGVLFCAWVDGPVGYFLCVAANWFPYFLLAKVAMSLKRGIAS
jgi:hypothetical protein